MGPCVLFYLPSCVPSCQAMPGFCLKLEGCLQGSYPFNGTWNSSPASHYVSQLFLLRLALMDSSPKGYCLLRLPDANHWVIFCLWTGEDHTAPSYLWEGPSLRGSAGGCEAVINLAQALKSLRPKLIKAHHKCRHP